MRLPPLARVVHSLACVAPCALAAHAALAAEASGQFTVQATPETVGPAGLSRVALDKLYQGGIEGQGHGEMLASGSPASGEAGYVAMERVDGRVAGRAGSFVLAHFGTMDHGAVAMHVAIVPGSGTGALAGIVGAMTIDPTHGHAYRLTYTLPGSK